MLTLHNASRDSRQRLKPVCICQVRTQGLNGMVVAGSRPSEASESWHEGPPRTVAWFSLAGSAGFRGHLNLALRIHALLTFHTAQAVDFSMEGGARLVTQLGDWAKVRCGVAFSTSSSYHHQGCAIPKTNVQDQQLIALSQHCFMAR